MSNNYDSKYVDDFIFSELQKLTAKVEANNDVNNALLSVLLENCPELIEKVKSKFFDISELTPLVNYKIWSDGTKDTYKIEVEVIKLRFDLIERGVSNSDSFIEVKTK
jgi:hypothetical protein